MKASIYNKVVVGSLILLTFASCTKVELLDKSLVSGQNTFSVKYEWNKDYFDATQDFKHDPDLIGYQEWRKYLDLNWKTYPDYRQDPDYPQFTEYQKYQKYLYYQDMNKTPIYLVMTRILNTRHSVFWTNANGRFWRELDESTEPEVPESPDEPEVSARADQEGTIEDKDLPESYTGQSVPLPNGEYIMMAFSKPREASQTLDGRAKIEVSKLDEFKADKAVGINQLAMCHVNAKASEIVVGKSWEDLNPGYGYVFEPGDERLYIARCNYLELNAGKPFVQPFQFAPLLQHVVVNFTIRFEKDKMGDVLDVSEKNIFAELSGVVPQVNLSTGLLNTSVTKKMIVTVEETGRTESDEDVIISYKASYNAFGFIGGIDKTGISGPGIFRLGIYLEHNGRTKVVRVVSNLSEKIEDQRLTELTGKVNERRKLKDEATLNIEAYVVIQVSTMNDNSNDGISGWQAEGNNVDVDA